MNVLIFALASVALAASVVFVVGGRPRTYSSRAAITASPDEVFAHLTRPELLTRWIGGLVASEDLTGEGLRVGARSREIIEEGGRRFEMESEVLQVTPGRLLSVRLMAEGMDIQADYTLEPQGGQTVVSLRQVARYGGGLRLAAPFLDGVVERKLARDFETLKRLAEQRIP
jgi:uncharacterized protein YndB with AHSA1/START domain